MPAQVAQPDPLLHAPPGNTLTQSVDPADDLVPGHHRHTGRPTSGHTHDPGDIAVADPARLDGDPDLPRPHRLELPLHEGESTVNSRLDSAIVAHDETVMSVRSMEMITGSATFRLCSSVRCTERLAGKTSPSTVRWSYV